MKSPLDTLHTSHSFSLDISVFYVFVCLSMLHFHGVLTHNELQINIIWLVEVAKVEEVITTDKQKKSFVL